MSKFFKKSALIVLVLAIATAFVVACLNVTKFCGTDAVAMTLSSCATLMACTAWVTMALTVFITIGCIVAICKNRFKASLRTVLTWVTGVLGLSMCCVDICQSTNAIAAAFAVMLIAAFIALLCYEKRLATVIEDMQRLDKEAEHNVQQIRELEAEKERLTQSLDAANKNYDRLREAKDTLQQSYNALESERDELKKANEELEQRIKELEEQGDYDEIKEQLEQYKQKFQELRDLFESLGEAKKARRSQAPILEQITGKLNS